MSSGGQVDHPIPRSIAAVTALVMASVLAGTTALAQPSPVADRVTLLHVHESDDLGVNHATGVVSTGSGSVYVLDDGRAVALGAGGHGQPAGALPPSVAGPAAFD